MTEETQETQQALEPEVVGKEPRIYSGDLRIGGAEIKCFVLDPGDGQEPKRLLSGRATTKAFGLTGRGQGMSRFSNSLRIKSKMSERLVQAIELPVPFTLTSGLPAALLYEA